MLQRRIWARIEGLRQVNHSGKSSKTQRCKSVQRRRYRGGRAFLGDAVAALGKDVKLRHPGSGA